MLKGRVWKFKDDVNTDDIIAAKYLSTADPAELGRHCMETADPEFSKKVKKGDIIVAGRNFGCGSSREHAPVAIKGCGVSCVIARSFARIFFRNSVNIGLPILESAEASLDIKEGDEIEVDLQNGQIRNVIGGKVYSAMPLPKFMQDIVRAGGLLKYLTKGDVCIK